MLAGFPNLFMLYGPNTNQIGGLQIVDMEEMVTRFALGCIGGTDQPGQALGGRHHGRILALQPGSRRG